MLSLSKHGEQASTRALRQAQGDSPFQIIYNVKSCRTCFGTSSARLYSTMDKVLRDPETSSG